MKISEVVFCDLKVGDRVRSSSTGSLGRICELTYEGEKSWIKEKERYDVVTIEWDAGHKSHVFHIQTDRIEYIGHKND